MKGKRIRKALALLGGFVGCGALAIGPAYANWVVKKTANTSIKPSISVGNRLAKPTMTQSGDWLSQKISFGCPSEEGMMVEATCESGMVLSDGTASAGRAIKNQAPSGDGGTMALGHVNSSSYSIKSFCSVQTGLTWPSELNKQDFSMSKPNNNMTCAITSSTGHYHVGESVKTTYTYTEESNPAVLAAVTSSIYANFIWTTDNTDTNVDEGWSWSLSEFTHSGTTWTHTDSNTIDSNATYYIRGQIQDMLTELSSDWKTIATISPVYTAANIDTSWSTSWAIPSTNTSSYALANKATVFFNYSDCGAYYTYYYYSTTNSKPAIPSSFYSGYQGSWTRSGATNSSFVIENLAYASQTYYWWIWAACTTTGTSTYSSAKSGSVYLQAPIRPSAPYYNGYMNTTSTCELCTWNWGKHWFVYTKWYNSNVETISVYGKVRVGVVTYETDYRSASLNYGGTQEFKSTEVGTSRVDAINIQVCSQISYGGATSLWYLYSISNGTTYTPSGDVNGNIYWSTKLNGTASSI